MEYTNSVIVSKLKPKCCAYSTLECCSLIEIPQTDEECASLAEILSRSTLSLIDREKAKSLGYEELAEWSTSSDSLFVSCDNAILLNLPKSILESD